MAAMRTNEIENHMISYALTLKALAPPTVWRPNVDDIRWVYPRGSKGDVEVWAPSKEVAAYIMRQNGFTEVDVTKIRQGRMPRIVPTPISTDFEKVSK